MTTVYRIVTQTEWAAARREGEYRGSAHDERDGFIHFSAAAQVAGTARKYYANLPDLLLLYVRTDAIAAPAVWRWEPARDGALFPHLYGSLPVAAVHRAEPLPFDANGEPRLPALES